MNKNIKLKVGDILTYQVSNENVGETTVNGCAGKSIKEFVEKDSDKIIERSKKTIPDDYKYADIDLSDEIGRYIEKEIKKELYNTGVCYAREVRTFGNKIPKTDIEKFPVLKDYNGQDISYIVYENVEII